VIIPNVMSGKRVILCVHGSTIRSILKHVEKLTEEGKITIKIF
jgi:bisphosphoglycerate-dependent phosphoglycerate mutase